ncbi:hypothetical protein FB45DRAFT_759174 [Roridomyces roridus]|uniref:Uncharacterized protein n=1 Tax=Roridomyces roridus TaxID=1738132 RepID=A0AAD7FE83_9AGAR|nr:hypothetical protein FB45DRAFT_759174 [Roridomyces roridus]
MYILSTVHVISDWILLKRGFIDNGETPDSTGTYLFEGAPLWLAMTSAVALTVNTMIADFVLIWRCWTMWNHNWVVVTLPILCTLAGTALGFADIHEQAQFIINPDADVTYFNFATPYFSLSLVTTCLATILIIYRIFMMSDSETRKARGYTRVIEIIVESAFLYSVTLIVFLPYLVESSIDDGYPQVVLAQMTGIAPTLIVARVTFGLARPDETWQGTMSSIRMRSMPSGSRVTNTVAFGGFSDGSHASKPESF